MGSLSNMSLRAAGLCFSILLWPGLSHAMLIGSSGVDVTFSVNGGAATDTPPGIIRTTDGTPISLTLNFLLDVPGSAFVGVSPFPAWSKSGSDPGDFASGPAGNVLFTTVTPTSRAASYTYVIDNTGFDDKDGDRWSFIFPPDNLAFFADPVAGGTSFHDVWDPRIVLTDTGAAAKTPEPAGWVLMLIGFGGLGAALRARRTSATPAVRQEI